MLKTKQPLTEERLRRVQLSLQKLAILSECTLIESLSELDVDFRVPQINNFARRIKSDAKEIQQHLSKSGRYNVKMTDIVEEHAGEIWRIVTLLNGLPIENIKEFADQLDKELEGIV
jgi:hypothetical protein